MSQSLISQYDDIASFIMRYQEWARRAYAPLMQPFSTTYWKFMWHFRRVFRETDFVRARQPAYLTELGGQVPKPSDDEGKLFHGVLFSEYPLDELGSAVRTRFPKVDFAKMVKLNKVRSTQLLRFKIRVILSFSFGLGTFILKSVPKSAVDSFVNYDQFQAWTFWITLAFVAYLGLGLTPMWIKQVKAKRMQEFFGDILEYVALSSTKHEGTVDQD